MIYFVSDGTGLTAEAYGQSLLAQFPELNFETMTMSFIDNKEKAREMCMEVDKAYERTGIKPVVFSTLVEISEQDELKKSNALVIDLFNTFLSPLEKVFSMPSAHTQGMSKAVMDKSKYQDRLDAIDYSLTHDDGVRTDQYNDADIIMVGVSRCGKTPTSLYLAMNFSLKACNYPLTNEDLEKDSLPDCLEKYRYKLVALTIKPVPLSRIRRKRCPDTKYASLYTCQNEVRIAKQLFLQSDIPIFDTTDTSIEEIASSIVRVMSISRERTVFPEV